MDERRAEQSRGEKRRVEESRVDERREIYNMAVENKLE